AGNTTISTTGINTGASGTVSKNGAGTLTMAASGTYTGGTTLSAGILDVQNSSALGTGAVAETSGAVIQVDGSGLNIANAITNLNGTGISNGGALINLANSNTWSGAITLGSASQINSTSGTLTLS